MRKAPSSWRHWAKTYGEQLIALKPWGKFSWRHWAKTYGEQYTLYEIDDSSVGDIRQKLIRNNAFCQTIAISKLETLGKNLLGTMALLSVGRYPGLETLGKNLLGTIATTLCLPNSWLETLGKNLLGTIVNESTVLKVSLETFGKNLLGTIETCVSYGVLQFVIICIPKNIIEIF